MGRACYLLATCAGIGRLPKAPGTWGSLLGALLGWAVVRVASAPVLAAAGGLSFLIAAAVCGAAERYSGRTDPAEIVLDEVWGMAVVIAAAPVGGSWGLGLAAFVLFRAFDIVKPPPLRRLALLPGGWGIMADDAGAAAYVLLVLWVASRVAG